MKLIVKVLLTFLKFLPADKVTFGNAVVIAMGNTIAKFPNLPYTLAALTALCTALSSAITNALTGTDTDKDALVTAEKNWKVAFKSTANYVNLIANGDTSIIIGAGFEPSKTDTTPGVLPSVLTLFTLIASTIKGWFGVSVKAFKGEGSKMYVYIAYPAAGGVTLTQNTGMLTVCGRGIYLHKNIYRAFG